MTQKIGTEGYGWIPRWYEGEKISYIVGDASNAYGKVTAPIWLKRGELSGTQYTPEKGWDENKLDMSVSYTHLKDMQQTLSQIKPSNSSKAATRANRSA